VKKSFEIIKIDKSIFRIRNKFIVKIIQKNKKARNLPTICTSLAHRLKSVLICTLLLIALIGLESCSLPGPATTLPETAINTAAGHTLRDSNTPGYVYYSLNLMNVYPDNTPNSLSVYFLMEACIYE